MSWVTSIKKLAIPFSVSLISFLAYSSQLLFKKIEPGDLTRSEKVSFNVYVFCVLFSYIRTCYTDPGHVPKNWRELRGEGAISTKESMIRWCKKCDAAKPPRAHHCKVCNRCVAKMDHHCPWTLSCTAHRNMPHFLRFLGYSVVAMVQLMYYFYVRLKVIWDHRKYPMEHGPSGLQLAHLFLLVFLNFIVLFGITLLFLRTLYAVAANTTAIESWEIERHEALRRRAKRNGGVLTGPNGAEVRLEHHEFPYDIGIWTNLVQGMGSANPLMWMIPFSPSPSLASGLSFETNEFLEPHLAWPPPDPDRYPLPKPGCYGLSAPLDTSNGNFSSMDIEAFRKRQQEDLKARRGMNGNGNGPHRRQPYRDEYDTDENESESDAASDPEENDEVENKSGISRTAPGSEWKNSEGERLSDYGVDEDEEYYAKESELPQR